jgi:hypothetical protein
LGKTPAEVAHLTPYELIELWRGYLWRREEAETTLASLVTVWIANTAGKALKKRVKVEDIIGSKRKKIELTDKDREMIKELYKYEVK